MKIGFLPLYIALYDQVCPAIRPEMQAIADNTAQRLNQKGFQVVQAPICRVEEEFRAAVELFKKEKAFCIVTLHLAYSPSLESAKILAESGLEIVMLDTTPDFCFGFDDTKRTMYNHGIHGVQDLANLLCRQKKRFYIEAGHMDESDVLDRLGARLKGLYAAEVMRHARVGSVGGRFAGMGDFCFDRKDLPMEIISYTPQSVTEEEIDQEAALDQDRFIHGNYDQDLYRKTLADSLKIRKWVQSEKLDAFTICFPGINRPEWNVVPFLEASKSMEKGIGYAGEGDCLTAAYCAAVMKIFPETTFSEMFCPDWKGNRIFVSHMGEVNLALCAQKPLLLETPYAFSDTENLIKGTCCLKSGKAVLSNLAPGPDGKFILSCASVEMSGPDGPSSDRITGWFTPQGLSVGDFLTAYSMQGGTHHLVISYGTDLISLETFASAMQWDFRVIG